MSKLSESSARAETLPRTNAGFACLDFVNSRFGDHRARQHWHDRLSSRTWQRWFQDRWSLEVDPGSGAPPVQRLRQARAALRSVLEGWRSGMPYRPEEVAALDSWLRSTTWSRRLAVTGTGLELRSEPARRDWAWVVSELIGSVADLVAEGEPSRLKVCDNPSCTWLFYDQSPNRSRRWCDAASCGNLVKVREFRARRRSGSSPPDADPESTRPASSMTPGRPRGGLSG